MNNEIWPKNGAFAAKRLSGIRVSNDREKERCRSGEIGRHAILRG